MGGRGGGRGGRNEDREKKMVAQGGKEIGGKEKERRVKVMTWDISMCV